MESQDEPSVLSVMSQVDEIYNGTGRWIIGLSDISNKTSVSSEYFYIGSENYCKFSFELGFESSNCSKQLHKLVSLTVKFAEKLPRNAKLMGSVSFAHQTEGKEMCENFTFKGNVDSFSISCDAIGDLNQYVVNENVHLIWRLKMRIGCIKWKSENKSITLRKRFNFMENDQTFNVLKKSLYSDQIFSDVTFRVHGGTVKAHRSILLIHGSFYRFYFTLHPNDPYVKVFGVDKDPFEQMLKYVYTGDIPLLDFTLACCLFAGAHQYEVHHLKEICFTYLFNNLTSKNVFVALSLAAKCHNLILKEKCIEFIKRCDSKELIKESVIVTK